MMKKLQIKALLFFLFVGQIANLSAQADPVFTNLNPSSQEFTITNIGDQSVDIANYQLCTDGFRYDSVGSLTAQSTLLAAGASLTLTWNDIQTNGNGTLILFTGATFSSSNPDQLRDYVRWGTSNFRINQGVNSGRWSSTTASISFTCSPESTSGIVTTGGTRGGSPGAWGDADAGTIEINNMATGNPNNTTSFGSDGLSAVICVDSQADPIVVDHATASTRSYLYVITDNSPNETILNITSSNAIDLNGAGVGTCLIWGWSYSGLGGVDGALATFGGGPLQALRDANCSDVSQQAITVIREAADGGTVAIDLAATGNPNNTTSFNGDTEAVICVDSQADPLVIIHENPGAENLSYRYVITNEDASEILAISPSATIDLNGAGVGTCQIWGWSYRGMADNGASFIGGPLSDLNAAECSDISDNAVTVIREAADGGTVAIDLAATGNPNNTTSFNGDTEAVICVDSQADPLVIIHENPGAENLSYRYVITNEDASEILAISPSATIDLNGAGVGTCQIWGWSYRGMADNGASFIGGPLSDLNAAECSDISDNAVTVIREAADGGTVAIDLAATGNPNNTTSFNGDTEAVICVDSQADPLVIIHENPGAENLSYRYVITNEDASEILAISPSATIDLNGAGVGTCQIWGWSYRGMADNGASFIGGPLSDLNAAECSDISDNAVTVIREAADGGTVAIDLAATGNPNNTTSFNGDTEAVICVDSQADPLVIIHENPGAENLSYRYVITNEDASEILAISPSATIDLNGAGVGTCQIWGWSYRGMADNGASFIGGPLSDLNAAECSDISDNAVTVIREAADGGTVAIDLAATGNPNNTTSFNGDTEAVICVDSQADPLVIIHENPGAENLSYRYVITNEDASEILAISPSATIDLNGAGVGTCQIWGWSYRGMADNGASFIGGPLSDLNAAECSDISDNAVTVIREAADGGTVAIDLAATGNPNNTTSFNGDTEAVICVDSQADPLVIIHENPGAENLSYRYVITNEDASEILAISPSATIDLNGAGVGTCQIWGWSYRGMADNGASFIGGPLSDLNAAECSDISDNAVTVIREAADGGTVAIDLAATGNPNNTTSFNGDTEAVICVDSQADPLVIIHENPGAENLSYRYVITNEDASEILAISPSATIDLNGAGVGTCQIWGWSYRGMADNGASFIGGPLSDLNAAECSDISDNAVTVIREAADGGTVAIDLAATGNPNNTTSFNGDTEAVICVDSQADPLVIIHENPGAENLSYRYVITNEDASEILAISPSATIDLNGAGVGTCQIWGWSYRGMADNGASFIGGPLSDLNAAECSDISDNAVTVIREAADGGTVAIDLAATGNPNNTTSFNGDTEAVICVDSQADPLVIIHENPGAENLSYRYVITNEDASEILAISPSATIDLNGAGVGTCQIWGWSYRGMADNGASFIGGPLSDLNAAECSDISDNAVTVIREAADGGTVSLSNGDTEISICAGDAIPDPLEVIHENPGAENLSYRYVITDANTGLILNVVNTNTIDLDGAGAGVCEIWGWSYRGVPNNGLDQIGLPLSSLDNLDCSDISDNAITVTRLTGADCDSLSVDEFNSDSFSIYPNPSSTIINIKNASNQTIDALIEVYDVTGRRVYQNSSDLSNDLQINVSGFENGVYLVNITDSKNNITVTKRIIKR